MPICQVCGFIKPLTANSTIYRHNFNHQPCPGAGHLPMENDRSVTDHVIKTITDDDHIHRLDHMLQYHVPGSQPPAPPDSKRKRYHFPRKQSSFQVHPDDVQKVLDYAHQLNEERNQ